jgi:uncharacterized protein YndB with AHSA1/START domain
MAFTSRQIAASASDTFAVLVDPDTYPRWLVGAQAIRDVDAAWPKVGAKFHHVVGFGPLRIPDDSEVLAIEQDTMLRLKVRARPFVSAVATFRLIGAGGRCVVTFEEEPAVRWLGNLVRVVLDPSVHLRNHRSLARLAAVVEERATR